MTEGIFDFLDATNLIGRIYSDERLVPIGNWGGDFGKLVSFILIFLFFLSVVNIFLNNLPVLNVGFKMEYYDVLFIKKGVCPVKNE